jgi:hypothetical protein
MKWVMGLFSEDMAKPLVLGFWDLLRQIGLEAISCMIIAVFRCFSEKLLLSSPDEINDLLKTDLRVRLSQLNGDDLLAQAK